MSFSGKRVLAAAAVALVIGGAGATGAAAAVGDGVCDSGEFCAYNLYSCSGILLESRAGSGTTKVDVADDATSSVKNRTSNVWVGVSVRTGLPDQALVDFAKDTAYARASASWDNKIDHFNVK